MSKILQIYKNIAQLYNKNVLECIEFYVLKKFLIFDFGVTLMFHLLHLYFQQSHPSRCFVGVSSAPISNFVTVKALWQAAAVCSALIPKTLWGLILFRTRTDHPDQTTFFLIFLQNCWKLWLKSPQNIALEWILLFLRCDQIDNQRV